jgi:signal transduction histidine kinase
MTPLIGEALQRFDMESALKESREQLRSLSSHLQAAREEERLRLAREIHDELGQTLTAALMELGLLKKEVKKSAPAVEKIASVTGLIDEAVGDVQRICAELRPRILDHLGLRAALEWQTKKFADRTGINCLLDIPHDSIKLATETETALFRIFQETLTNVSRHAKATQVSVRLAIEDRALILEVRDNGTGISKSRLSAENAFGIMGIRERAHELGGDVIFTSARNKGTTVTVTVPHERRKTGA